MSRAGPRSPCRGHRRDQRGLTLVELMVGMAVGLLVAAAAAATLVVVRQGFNAVDAGAQLRDNMAFAAGHLARLARQAGYADLPYALAPPSHDAAAAAVVAAAIGGFDNASYDAKAPDTSFIPRKPGSDGYGSDILVLRYQAAETAPGSGVADGAVIDCTGTPASTIAAGRDSHLTSVFHIASSSGELALMCTAIDAAGAITTGPVVPGVENLQLLYGVDGVDPGKAPAAGAPAAALPLRYLRADQMVVPGDAAGTQANWQRVRSIRIGLVLRGAEGSALERDTGTWWAFGAARAGAGAADAPGSALAGSADAGTVYTPPADGRMRQQLTFAVHLRNGSSP